MYADNVDFSGSDTQTRAISSDGQILIGSTTAPNIRAGTLGSSDSSITWTTGAGTITGQITGGTTVGKTITGDSGGALSPSDGNWNLLGLGSFTTSGSGSSLSGQLTGLTNHSVLVGAGTTTITKLPVAANGQLIIGSTASDPVVAALGINANGNTVAGAGTLTINPYNCAKWIVDATANIGTHQTIAAAITAAASGDTIFIRPGTYTENLTLKAGVNLTAFGSDASANGTGKVVISGTATLTTAGSVTISGIQLQTNAAALLAVTGSAASIVNLVNCYLSMGTSAITYSSSSASSAININYCQGNITTTGIAAFTHSSAGVLTFTNTTITNTGLSVTAATASAGTLRYRFSYIEFTTTTSGTNLITIQKNHFNTAEINTIDVTVGGSGVNTANASVFSAGTASSISIGSTLVATGCQILSTNTNAVTGAGTLTYSGLSFSNVALMNTTTQVGGIVQGGLLQAPSAGFIGEQISASATAVSVTSAVVANITSISLTAGIWDISCLGRLIPTGVNSFLAVGISAISAALTGPSGVNYSDTSAVTSGAFQCFSVPNIRATLTTTTPYYVVCQANFSTGTCTANGRVTATRVG